MVPLQFPLTPLFLNFFDFIQISPLQLAPSAYRILASCEAVSHLTSGGYLSHWWFFIFTSWWKMVTVIIFVLSLTKISSLITIIMTMLAGEKWLLSTVGTGLLVQKTTSHFPSTILLILELLIKIGLLLLVMRCSRFWRIFNQTRIARVSMSTHVSQ
ncbi:hypothetical protein TIFTF001_029772 [Ficus carica]|uniref:Uncharacterized protein n=1 Tax=Ficus carica TaxID=3494 RepID=A0AA88IYL0_FICCA|nr:hypothetical protein TIFTF001_029772 [Ficus carica]